MKKLFVILSLFISAISVFAMDWSEYEAMCFINNKEPNYKEKSIKKEQFDSLKNHFGEILSNAKNTINDCNGMLSALKQEKKLVESLLVTE